MNITDREVLKTMQRTNAERNADFTSAANARAAVNEAHSQIIVIPALLAAESMASDTSDVLLFRTIRKIKINAVRVIPRAGLTGHDTNYATVAVTSDDDAGGSDTTLASGATTLTGGTGTWTAHRSVALTITAANAIVDAGKAIHFTTAKAAAGVVVPVCFIELDIEDV